LEDKLNELASSVIPFVIITAPVPYSRLYMLESLVERMWEFKAETTEWKVNVLHKQTIDRPVQSIRIVAREKQSGIYQALEHEEYPFIFGVQWYPEYLIQVKKQRQIFKKLVEVAKNRDMLVPG